MVPHAPPKTTTFLTSPLSLVKYLFVYSMPFLKEHLTWTCTFYHRRKSIHALKLTIIESQQWSGRSEWSPERQQHHALERRHLRPPRHTLRGRHLQAHNRVHGGVSKQTPDCQVSNIYIVMKQYTGVPYIIAFLIFAYILNRFVSKMFHPNVYADGGICLDILQNRWSPTYDVSAILTSIQSLLDEPNPNSPANSVAAQLYQVRCEWILVVIWH